MVDIPDRLEYLFTATIEKDDDSYHIEVPQDALDMGTVSAGETYRTVILGNSQLSESQSQQKQPSAESTLTPPVNTGDVREVTIETLGDQGDGIAKIERGYVLIVPGARPDDEVTVEVTDVRENFAFTTVYEDADRAGI
ncbi:TRAM domain-containing protein [Halococcus sediminicola]|uniref:TRAM domain-containing protein n=1 Tax=Halococcus sediminicola TaxID=1264579 RepID=UPI000678C351|nr:TRAM domain-containing protein [Halococcus sediminicola]